MILISYLRQFLKILVKTILYLIFLENIFIFCIFLAAQLLWKGAFAFFHFLRKIKKN